MKKAFIVKTGTCYPHATDYYLLKSYLVKNGWKIAKSARQTDLIVINTCAFTKDYEDKAIEYIHEALKQKKRNAQVIVTGCLPRINHKRLKRVFRGVAISAGSLEKIDTLLASKFSIKDIAYIGVSDKPKNAASREYLLRIGWGCSGRCSYCAVKHVFGMPRSRPVQQILKEYEMAYKKGHRYFALIANDSGSYGKDSGGSLSYLLHQLCGKYKNTKFALSHILPNTLQGLLPEVKQFIQTGRIARINIPVESGSDRILSLMRREYTVNSFKECIQRLIKLNPDLDIRTDIMVGFPSETNPDFLSTLRMVEWLGRHKARFQYLKYSPRPFTKASLMPNQIPLRVKEKRIAQLKRLCEVSYSLRDKRILKKLSRKIVSV